MTMIVSSPAIVPSTWGTAPWSIAEARRSSPLPAGAQDDEVRGRLGADEQLLAALGESLAHLLGVRCRADGAVTALAGHRIHERLADADLLGADLDEVAREVAWVTSIPSAASRSSSCGWLRIACWPRMSMIRCCRAVRVVEIVMGQPGRVPARCCSTSQARIAFWACSRFSDSSPRPTAVRR